MKPPKLDLPRLKESPRTFNFRLLADLASMAQDSGSISTVSTYESNLYIGTSSGRLLHFHLFDDAQEYILIGELEVSNHEIKKLLILTNVGRVLVLAGTVTTVYTLPELTPCHIGKVRDVGDILTLSRAINPTRAKGPQRSLEAPGTSSRDTRLAQTTDDKVIFFTSTKIRILQVSKEGFKLLKDINYAGSVKGISTMSTMSSNYSNLVLLANNRNYDIIDVKGERKIPLFEYSGQAKPRNSDKKIQNPTNSENADPGSISIPPFIIPYIAKDKNQEEYLLTIESGDETSIAMFINSLGDVTRGTISWLGEGYPSGGVVVVWPYVFGAFVVGEVRSLVVSSLETLENVLVHKMEEEPIKSKIVEEYIDPIGRKTTEETSKSAEETTEETSKSVNELETTEDKSNSAQDPPTINEPEPIEDSSKPSEPEPIEDSSKSAQELESAEDISKAEDISQPGTSSKTTVINSPRTVPLLKLQISTISEISLGNSDLVDILSKVNFSSREVTPYVGNERDVGSLVMFDESKLWLGYMEDEFISQVRRVEKILGSEILDNKISQSCKADIVESSLADIKESSLEDIVESSLAGTHPGDIQSTDVSLQILNLQSICDELESAVDQFNGVYHTYLLHLIILLTFNLNQHEKAIKYLLRLKGGSLVVDPYFVIYLLSDIGSTTHTDSLASSLCRSLTKNLTVYASIEKLPIFKSSPHGFLMEYINRIFPDLVAGPQAEDVRKIFYSSFTTDDEALKFIEKDAKNWRDFSSLNQKIVESLLNKELLWAVLGIYEVLLSEKVSVSEKYCSLIVRLLEVKMEEPSSTSRSSKPQSLIAKCLEQLPNLTSEATYKKILLEILKFDQAVGFQYMRRNKTSKFKDCHQRIMKEISLTDATAEDFSLLRIEYLEESYIEAINSSQEKSESGTSLSSLISLLSPLVGLHQVLLHELERFITSTLFTEENSINFEILSKTFSLENSLNESKWPKISWIDYIQVNMTRSECKHFIGLYLKIYELLLVSDPKLVEEVVSLMVTCSDLFSFFELFREDSVIEKLISLGDYSTAEYYAVNGKFPLPKEPFYPRTQHSREVSREESDKITVSHNKEPSYSEKSQDLSLTRPLNPLNPLNSHRTFNQVKQDLQQIFDYYIEQDVQKNFQTSGVQHFLAAYNGYFTAREILSMLPSNIPLAHVKGYLTWTLAELKTESRSQLMHKAISKVDSSFTKNLYESLAR